MKIRGGKNHFLFLIGEREKKNCFERHQSILFFCSGKTNSYKSLAGVIPEPHCPGREEKYPTLSPLSLPAYSKRVPGWAVSSTYEGHSPGT